MILVDIYIPSVDQNYDFEIDEDMVLEELVDKLSVLLSAYLNTNLKKNHNEFMLCSYKKMEILDYHKTLRQSGISNGDHLLFV